MKKIEIETKHNMEWFYNFAFINNFDILFMKDKVSIHDINRLLEVNTTAIEMSEVTIELILNGNGKCMVVISSIHDTLNISYEVSRKEIFNIAYHIYLYGGTLT